MQNPWNIVNGLRLSVPESAVSRPLHDTELYGTRHLSRCVIVVAHIYILDAADAASAMQLSGASAI